MIEYKDRRAGMDKNRISRTHVVFAVIVVAAALIAFVGGRAAENRALGGQFDDAALVEVKGTIKYIDLFCYGTDCKWVVSVSVGSAVSVGNGPMVLSIPESGDVQAVDMTDSRVNLWVQQDSKKCYEDGSVKVCEYLVKDDMTDITYIYMESIGSSGLPEYDATPR